MENLNLMDEISETTYCPANVSLSEVWINGSVSPCFLETLTASVIGTFIVVGTVLQLILYKRYATRLLEAQVPRKRLFQVQVAVHVFLTSLGFLELLLRYTDVLGLKEPIYGYLILYLSFQTLTWPLCLAVLFVERHFQLPTPPSGGHGLVLLVTWSGTFITENLALLSLNKMAWWMDFKTLDHQLEFGFWMSRYVLTFAAFSLGLKAPGISAIRDYSLHFDNDDRADGENLIPRENSEGSAWKGFWQKIKILFPYIWPKGYFALQFRVCICFGCLIGVRVVNIFVPIMYKKIVDNLTEEKNFPWKFILIYSAIKLLQGGGTGVSGLFNNLRSFIWIPIQQYSTRSIQVKLFSHIHDLSLKWHLSRKTGEVFRIMDRGTSSVNSLLSYVVFSILPTLVDMIVAVVFFMTQFNFWFGLIVLVSMVLYLIWTIGCTEWRTKYKRKMNLADNDLRTFGLDSILNYETVKYYGAEDFEIKRYQDSILNYQTEEWKSLASLQVLNLFQSLIINGGLLTGSLFCGYTVSQGNLTVGDYVLFGTYMLQLMTPLNYIGSIYRIIQEAFINMENMLDLLAEKNEIQDVPDALPLVVTKGEIEFKDVSFHYSIEKPVIKNISFVVKPGETVALVGPTGSGKSTITKLLFRFYDPISGGIFIDNQNIKYASCNSVRRSIGVVPQDIVLFNETLRYNLNYGNQNAGDEEIVSAARLASIHESIKHFPDQYETRVGERGLKLSGGEKQRVGIARMILKSPQIILMDEATSSLDARTEIIIEQSLKSVLKNRTSIIVAHRLSTVVSADRIIVLQDGEIVETGRHEYLLILDGLYSRMWNEQIREDVRRCETDE